MPAAFHRYLLFAVRRTMTISLVSDITLKSSQVGATENAGVENAIRPKLQGWKMQEWKEQEQIAGVENAGVSRMERQPEIILRQP